MKTDNETKDNLLVSAKREFMEKGYEKASLRSICRSTGVTTGALYFFFKDKEDLFAAIVQPTLDRIIALLSQHTKQELMELQEHPDAKEDNMQDDMVASKMILQSLYKDYDNILLLLTKSQGSRYEHCIDENEAQRKHCNALLHWARYCIQRTALGVRQRNASLEFTLR